MIVEGAEVCATVCSVTGELKRVNLDMPFSMISHNLTLFPQAYLRVNFYFRDACDDICISFSAIG